MSTWYKTGAVSVTNGSKNVVGTGTAWSVMISVGDVFTLDNSILYEIQTITDDLHIVLDRNYEGSTATEQTYTIIPWSVKRSLNSEILDRINKLLEWAHEVFVTQWTTDTNGDYEVSTTLDKNVVPKVNNGASLGTTLKKWAKAYLTALSINGVDILPTVIPTAASIPIADANGNIDSGWLKDASATVKGVVKVGSNISVADGVISIPDASTLVKGTAKIGTNLSVVDGVISVPEATEAVKGVVELATSAEVLAGEDDERAVTPAGFKEAFGEFYPVGVTPTYVDSTNFTVSGDLTAIFTQGRVLKITDTGGTFNAICATSAYDSGTELTTVTVAGDTIDSGLSAVLYAVQQVTGQIWESGSNANGNYVKFADGMMICWATGLSVSGLTVNVMKSVLYTFPSTFIGLSSTSVGARFGVDAAANVTTKNSGSSVDYTECSFNIVSTSPSYLNINGLIDYHAIGRWY